MKRGFFQWLEALAALFALAAGAAAGGGERPNIVFFLGDDQRSGVLGC